MSKVEDLELIGDKIKNCDSCSLSLSRTNVVIGEGSPDSPIMLVGEGPGANEDLQGRPFVGRAGNLLDKLLKEIAKIERENLYITNVVKCRPPKNRVPTTEEMEKCSHFLMAQITVIKPKIIVALGSTALNFFLKQVVPITKHRGRFKEWYGGIYIFPTFHPSYLLRNRSEKEGSPLFYAKLDMQAIGYMYHQLKSKPNINLKSLIEKTEKGIIDAENRIKG
ncbi:DNA polymerase [Marinitoga hydrogenitolerans DSM 16785]|uniref:Type-4 uracil-DNA glycosylase n=1 Tax=Marinitoga hydrogenitolerans (strain DSM 16785 / JCM 12826 / AT1271) TaxID=1122195 RepID=A0A1M4SZH9_MARH1|nr:uracil-DNA glycosylase [Marinitoga hydrogenitolerans]SHE37554.1 DNA polymerase [Marinitoga hydrogenitolerans DSM 16785]